jgi:hypothetical protein
MERLSQPVGTTAPSPKARRSAAVTAPACGIGVTDVVCTIATLPPTASRQATSKTELAQRVPSEGEKCSVNRQLELWIETAAWRWQQERPRTRELPRGAEDGPPSDPGAGA